MGVGMGREQMVGGDLSGREEREDKNKMDLG